jgi:hypothetical protein
MDSGIGVAVTLSTLQQLLTNIDPAPEAVAAMPGTGQMASRDDHKHARLSSATVSTLNASSEATVSFSRTFAAVPCVQCMLVEAADNQPVVFKVKQWVQDAQSNYIGCIVRGYRSSILPSLSGVLLIGPLISALANFNVFGGSASGAQFCCLAIQPSN